jgi:hypothetical protein
MSISGPIHGSNDSLKARSLKCFFSAALCASLPVSATFAADLPTGGKSGTRAFVLSNTYIGGTSEPGTCAKLSDGTTDIFLKTLPPEQREQISKTEREKELYGRIASTYGFKWRWLATGDISAGAGKNRPDALWVESKENLRLEDLRKAAGIPEGKGGIVFNKSALAYDSCTNPQDFPALDSGLRPYDGKLAFGMNLDGKRGSNKFTSPTGEKNVNNQLWRVLGCYKQFREFGEASNMQSVISSAAAPTLIEISGIDNEVNDSAVEVAVYASADQLVMSANGSPLSNATYSIDSRPELIARTQGSIANGVVITEPFDVRMRYKEQIIDEVRHLRGTRIRATLKPNGAIEGGFFGYYTLESYYDSIYQMTQMAANITRLSCPAIYSGIHKYADGYPDPKTGRNTAISTAVNFVGVPAFVVKPADKSTVVNTH